MQLATPIDIEDALRIDLGAILSDYRFFAPPLPPDLKAGDVVIERVGGARATGVSYEQDVTVGAYADSDADAVNFSNEVYSALTSLPVRETTTQYSAATASLPYADFDPRAQELCRQSFRATLITPGSKIEL